MDPHFLLIFVFARQGCSWVLRFLLALTLGQERLQLKALMQSKDLKS